MLFKFSEIDNRKEWFWDNIYQREALGQLDRIVIGCKDREIPLILELCKDMEGPFWILYVLHTSRVGNKPGRYQSSQHISYEQLEVFLYEHQEFFEQDGRHHLWIVSASNEGQFIFDSHNFIYGYGLIESYIETLEKMSFKESNLEIPSPHYHSYHFEFDDNEDSIISDYSWVYFPLEESDFL